MQGHSSPGFYARAFLEGRLTEAQMLGFRQEVDGKGLSSYPHPWLMPDFWQFPTVSMGLGPIMAIYQARFLKYLGHRGLARTEGRKVWAFLGDGETDEPESLGAIGMAGREHLDNLIFVVNCNLQRLDGPVRGNGKIIQELEAEFRGAGWNVLKVVWGSGWDRLLARDSSGMLLQRMEETVDGDYQALKSKNGAYVREHFFGKYPETRALVADMSDDEIWALARGGHDPQKVYAAYAAAVRHGGQPTVILAKTVKGHLKTKVTRIEAGPDGLTAHFEGGGAPATEVFDKVLVAVGRKPNGRLVGAENAGVRVDERGYIPVDKQMRTNMGHIFAIGDLVGQPMLAHKAVHEGKVAAEVAAGRNSAFDARVIPSVAYTDPEVAWAGLTENEAKARGVQYGKGVFPWAASGRSLSLGRDEGLTKVLFDAGTGRIVGCGIVGPSAGDLVAEAALAIEMGADAADIGATIHPHPTLSETVGMAAEAFEGTITDLYMPKKR